MVAVCSFYPCCDDDDCSGEVKHSETAGHSSDEEEHSGFCSPFSACGSCAASVEMEPLSISFSGQEQGLPLYNVYHVTDREGIYPSLFQPPRC
jgi:hypothetical protein